MYKLASESGSAETAGSAIGSSRFLLSFLLAVLHKKYDYIIVAVMLL